MDYLEGMRITVLLFSGELIIKQCFLFLFIVAPTVLWGSVWILFCYAVLSVHLAEEEIADCFTLICNCSPDVL